MFREVPVLPVVIPLGAVVLALLLWRLHRTGRLTVPRAAVALALAVYAAGVVANTVFPIFLDKPVTSAPWDAHLVLVPLVDYEVADALTNVLVFVPLGMLVPLLLTRTSWWRVVLAAAAFSLAIEVTQYVTAHLLGGATSRTPATSSSTSWAACSASRCSPCCPASPRSTRSSTASAGPRRRGRGGSRGSRLDGNEAGRARSAVER